MSCKKMIPLYPVRYAVKGKAGTPAYASQSTLEKTFPPLEKASYTLQTIPNDFYILIVESFGATETSVFRLFHNSTSRDGFIEVDWEKYSKSPGAKPVYVGGSKSYIPINHQVKKIHIGMSEYPVTPKMANDLTGKYKNETILQKIPVGSWAKTSPSPHTFHVDKLEGVLEEFASEGHVLYHEKLPTFKTGTPQQVANDMEIEFTPEQLANPKKDKRIVIALHDPVGITEDLNAFLGIQQQAMQKYVEKEGHRYTSGKLVSDYINSVVPNQADIKKRIAAAAEKIRAKYKYSRYRGVQTERALKESTKDITAEMREPLERAYKALKGGKSTATSIVQHRNKYEAKIKSFEPDILASASDALAWVKLIKKGEALDKHLALHDHECPRSWQHYEKQVSNCINSIISSKEGENFVFELIQAKPEDSPLWKALAKGDKTLWEDLLAITSHDSLAKGTDLVSKLSEFGVQDETALLSGLLKPFLTKNAGKIDIVMPRLSAVLKHRIGYVITQHTVTSTAVYNLAVDYIHDGKNLTGVNAKIHTQALTGIIKTTTVSASKTVPLYTLEKVGEIRLTKYTPLNAPSLGKDNPLRKIASGKIMGALGNVVTVAGAIASGVTLEKAVVNYDANKQDGGVGLATLASAGVSLFSTNAAVMGLVVNTSQNMRGFDQASKALTKASFIRVAGYAGAVASAMTAVSDGLQANQLFKLGDSDSAQSRVASSVFNGLTAGATAAATYSAAGAIAGNAAATALVLGPVGWFVLAIVLAGAAIYYATKSDKEKDTPAEFWLKHSPWGFVPRLDNKEETEVFYTAFFKPQVSADWDDEWSADILTIRFYLPQYQTGKSVFEWKKAVTANLDGRKLKPVLFEHGQTYMSKPYDEVDWDKEFRIYEQVEVGKGYAVVVVAIHADDSTKVNFGYNYYPHGVESGLILTHDKGGMNWEFSDDLFFKSTTNEDKLEILSAQERLEYIK